MAYSPKHLTPKVMQYYFLSKISMEYIKKKNLRPTVNIEVAEKETWCGVSVPGMEADTRGVHSKPLSKKQLKIITLIMKFFY